MILMGTVVRVFIARLKPQANGSFNVFNRIFFSCNELLQSTFANILTISKCDDLNNPRETDINLQILFVNPSMVIESALM